MDIKQTARLYVGIAALILFGLYLGAGFAMFAFTSMNTKKLVCDETLLPPSRSARADTAMEHFRQSCHNEPRTFSEELPDALTLTFLGVPILIARSIPIVQCRVFGNCHILERGG